MLSVLVGDLIVSEYIQGNVLYIIKVKKVFLSFFFSEALMEIFYKVFKITRRFICIAHALD